MASNNRDGSAPSRTSGASRDLAADPDRDATYVPHHQHSQSAAAPLHNQEVETFATLGNSPYWDQPYDAHQYNNNVQRASAAQSGPGLTHGYQQPSAWTPDSLSTQPNTLHNAPLYSEENLHQEYLDSDTIPLTSSAQPVSHLSSHHEPPSRTSFQTVSDVDTDSAIARNTLHPNRDVEYGNSSSRHQSYGMLSPNDHDFHSSRPSSTSGALLYAGSIVRAVSQRVVNISGDTDVVGHQVSQRQRSRSPSRSERRPSIDPRPAEYYDDGSYPSQTQNAAAEKVEGQEFFATEVPALPRRSQPPLNPLKGRSLGIFGPESPIRMKLSNALVNPYIEPIILLLIVFQAILLTIESAPNVFSDGNGRPERWGQRWIDWAMLGLFLVFTLELCARIVVSGFILNAAEYSTIDRKKGIRAAIEDQYRAVFQPQRHKSVKASLQFPPEPSAISRSFTTFVQGQQALPKTLEEQLRFRLARRAFLRHSFNRLDFIAVVAYWISLILGVAGLESRYHLYVFKMLSCLRVLRLLAVTHGTSVSLSSHPNLEELD